MTAYILSEISHLTIQERKTLRYSAKICLITQKENRLTVLLINKRDINIYIQNLSKECPIRTLFFSHTLFTQKLIFWMLSVHKTDIINYIGVM